MAMASAPHLSDDDLATVDRYWRAANYLAACQIYLTGNPLPGRALTPGDVKPRLLGHWGTTPGLTLVYAHLNRVISARDLDVVHVTGPGHGGPATLACCWLDGSYTDVYPDVTRDGSGMARLFRQFSFPGGVPSHVAPETPGSLHEGGELGYALSHAYGAAFDHPDLLVAAIVGDGEAETGPLAAGWHGNKFLDPVHDGAVLPILHLNGYKIANPSVLARIPEEELDQLLRGCGHEPVYVTGDDPALVHHALAAAGAAGLGFGPGLGAAALAGRAIVPGRHPDLGFVAVRRLLKRDLHRIAQVSPAINVVGATTTSGAARRPATENVAEDVTEHIRKTAEAASCTRA